MIAVQDAINRLIELAPATETEEVFIGDASGRVLAEAVMAQRNQPPFNTSAMDGFAIKENDAQSGNSLTVTRTIPAGASVPDFVTRNGEAVRIYTGAPVPSGTDRILIQEDVHDHGTRIVIKDEFERHSFVRSLGSDFKKGFKVSPPQVLTPKLISLLAAMNAATVKVYRKPLVTIVPTGDELVMPGHIPASHQIVASNIFGLKSLLEANGCRVSLLPIAKDNAQSVTSILKLAAESDLVVTVGGASVGDFDLVQDGASQLGYAFSFYKIAMRPGKPLFAGRNSTNLLVGLPGNPVSALVCGYVFLIPVIQTMQGLDPTGLQRFWARLKTPLASNGPREHYARAVVDHSTGEAVIAVHERQDSSLLKVLHESNALLIRKPGERAKEPGERAQYINLSYHLGS